MAQAATDRRVAASWSLGSQRKQRPCEHNLSASQISSKTTPPSLTHQSKSAETDSNERPVSLQLVPATRSWPPRRFRTPPTIRVEMSKRGTRVAW